MIAVELNENSVIFSRFDCGLDDVQSVLERADLILRSVDDRHGAFDFRHVLDVFKPFSNEFTREITNVLSRQRLDTRLDAREGALQQNSERHLIGLLELSCHSARDAGPDGASHHDDLVRRESQGPGEEVEARKAVLRRLLLAGGSALKETIALELDKEAVDVALAGHGDELGAHVANVDGVGVAVHENMFGSIGPADEETTREVEELGRKLGGKGKQELTLMVFLFLMLLMFLLLIHCRG